MGAAQKKEATAYFTRALTAAVPPDTDAFLEHVKQYEQHLCGGSELSGVAQPIAVALFHVATTNMNNTTTDDVQRGQLRWLLQLCAKTLRRVLDNSSEAVDAATPALLHLTELLLRHVLRLTKGQSVVLVSVLESGGETTSTSTATALKGGDERNAGSAHAVASSSNDLLKEDGAVWLCNMCFAVLIRIPLSNTTVRLHLEVLRLLLTMTSSALHHSTDFREDTMDLFTELLMSSTQLQDFLEALLKIVVNWGNAEWETQAPLLYHEGCQPSMRNLFLVFGGGKYAVARASKQSVPYVVEVQTSNSPSLVNPASKTTTGVSSASGVAGVGNSSSSSSSVLKDPASLMLGSCSCWEQLGRHAAALLCVLIAHQKGGGRNPALEYIVAITDGTPVAFARLLAAIRAKVTRYPEISILLYVLLHDHHEFLHTVLNEDAALFVSMMQRLLELTYKTCKDVSRPGPAVVNTNNSESIIAADGAILKPTEDVLETAVLGRLIYYLRTFSYPFINFMSGTLLLLVSQDCVVNRLLCRTPCLPGHFLERYDLNAPVGALAVVVLALGITKGFNERNEALIAVFAPCLVNLAPYVHDMDTYTSQRVSGLLTLVLKKIHRASALLKAATAGDTANGDTTKAAADTPSTAATLNSSKANVVASAEEAQALEYILAMYLRQLRTIVEGIEALLRGAGRHNEHLIYELLYARGKIIDDVEAAVKADMPFAASTKQLLMSIVEMIKNCEADIASSDQAQSPQEIIAILRRGQRQGSEGTDNVDGAERSNHNSKNNIVVEMTNSSGGGHNATGASGAETEATATATSDIGVSRSPSGPDGNRSDGVSMDLVYSYEESPHSYDFFGPFVWSILLSAARAPGAALWCHRSSELALFPH